MTLTSTTEPDRTSATAGEWGYDQLLKPQVDVILGKTDTMADLAFDGAGALAAGVLASHQFRHRSSTGA